MSPFCYDDPEFPYLIIGKGTHITQPINSIVTVNLQLIVLSPVRIVAISSKKFTSVFASSKRFSRNMAGKQIVKRNQWHFQLKFSLYIYVQSGTKKSLIVKNSTIQFKIHHERFK